MSGIQNTEYLDVSVTLQLFDYDITILEACNAEMDGTCN